MDSSASLLLFMCVFTSQAAVLVLAPILVELARDLDVSTAAAGQLRMIAAPVAALVAVLVARSAARLPVRVLLFAGTLLVAAGSVASAAAPSFVALALAQVPVWIGVAVLVTGSVGAAGSWSAPAERTRVVARALAGAPAAWVVGMPVIGFVADINWRFAFLAVPLPAAIVTAAILVRTRPAEDGGRPKASLAHFLRDRRRRWWAASELLAMSSWAGTLVFGGALFVDAYGTSPRVIGLLLAAVALAYLIGNAVGSRIDHECVRRALAWANVVAAAAVALMWIITPNAVVSVAFFSSAAVVVAARTVIGTAYGFNLAGERKLEVGAARAVITHLGYLAGSFAGGAALAVGGRPAVGAVFATLLLAATAPYLSAWRQRCPRPRILGAIALARHPQSA